MNNKLSRLRACRDRRESQRNMGLVLRDCGVPMECLKGQHKFTLDVMNLPRVGMMEV